VAVEPQWELATVYDAIGDQRSAHATFVRAVSLQPANAQTWQQLGEFDLRAGRRREAVHVLRQAMVLEPHSPSVQSDLGKAQAALAAAGSVSTGAAGR
ncbi:MAG: hypothetical protein JO086_12995, partial [Acidimicrobiia bacterium]|nr:hypothetical protein [Acidimicrobiia bacterium]